MVKKKVTLSLDSDIYNSYRQFCDENGLLISGKIQRFMQDELDMGDSDGE